MITTCRSALLGTVLIGAATLAHADPSLDRIKQTSKITVCDETPCVSM